MRTGFEIVSIEEVEEKVFECVECGREYTYNESWEVDGSCECCGMDLTEMGTYGVDVSDRDSYLYDDIVYDGYFNNVDIALIDKRFARGR